MVGGGITGSLVASELARVLSGDGEGVNSSSNHHHHQGQRGEVLVFDQGRRGPGGRASHRSVGKKRRSPTAGPETDGTVVGDEEFVVLPDDTIDESDFQFDHGCK